MLSVIILGSSEHAVRRRGASSGASESGWMKERWPASGAAAAAGLYAVRISRVNSPLMYLRLGLYRPHVRDGGGPLRPPLHRPFIHTYGVAVRGRWWWWLLCVRWCMLYSWSDCCVVVTVMCTRSCEVWWSVHRWRDSSSPRSACPGRRQPANTRKPSPSWWVVACFSSSNLRSVV